MIQKFEWNETTQGKIKGKILLVCNHLTSLFVLLLLAFCSLAHHQQQLFFRNMSEEIHSVHTSTPTDDDQSKN